MSTFDALLTADTTRFNMSGSGATAFGLNEVFYGPVLGASVRF